MLARSRQILAAFIISLGLAGALAHAEQGGRPVLHLMATDFPPYTSNDVAGQGLVTAITQAALKAVGYDSTVVIHPWARALAEMQHGQYDAILAIWYQPQRARYLAFSDALWTNEIGFYGRRNRPIDVSNLSALQPYRIGIVRDYANPAAFDAANLDTDSAVDDLTNMRKLAAGRLDLVLVDKTLGQFLVRSKLPSEAKSLEWRTPSIATMPLYVGFSRFTTGYEGLVADFNRGLAMLHSSGEYDRIVRRIAPDALP